MKIVSKKVIILNFCCELVDAKVRGNVSVMTRIEITMMKPTKVIMNNRTNGLNQSITLDVENLINRFVVGQLCKIVMIMNLELRT
jgi:hypothetical protein